MSQSQTRRRHKFTAETLSASVNCEDDQQQEQRYLRTHFSVRNQNNKQNATVNSHINQNDNCMYEDSQTVSPSCHHRKQRRDAVIFCD